MPLADVLLITSGLLLLAMVAASVCRHLAIPYTVLLVLLGLAVNFLATDSSVMDLLDFREFHLTPDLVLFVFLPALVFETALSLDARALLKNLIPVLVLAIIGMLVSVVLVGVGVWWSLGMPLVVALLFGSLISATDPVAVVALFKELGVSKRLTILVEGESLMNDATAIVLFNILLAMLVQDNFSSADGLLAVGQFFKVFFGGVLVGTCIALVMSELLVRLYHGNQSIPVVLSLVLAYLSFIIAEHELHVSGVMAVLSAAITLNLTGLSRLSKPSIDTIHTTWEFLVLIFNSLLFVLIGMSVDLILLVHFWQSILWATIAVSAARAVSVYLLIPATTRSFSLPTISWAERHIMWWGGLKGGLAIAIVMAIPESVSEKQLLVVLTLGVVLISLVLNATTIRWLMHFLKMDVLDKTEQAELKQSMQQVTQSVDKVLHSFATLHLFDNAMESSVEYKLHQSLDAGQIILTNEQLLKQVHLQALRAETEEIEYLYDIGVVNYYTLVTFKEILRVDQQHSIDYLKSMGIGWLQPSPLLNFERMVIHFLQEKNWAQNLLMQYQTRRFANKILHDIAGVLMAHKGLQAIHKIIDQGLDEQINKELLHPLELIYQKRLKRRQNRLHYFNENYPAFYRQYEAFIFQKVALRYSLQLVRKSNEHGMVSAKVLQIITKKLTASLGQLSSFEMSLPLANRDAWINQVPLFANLPAAFLKQMASEAHYANFLPEDIIFYQGDVGGSLYIILSGHVKILITNAVGEHEQVAERGEGALIGIRALRANSNRSATVVAKTYVTCLRLTAKDILRFAIENEALAERLQQTGLLKVNG
ncbi:MAG: cation:proton antiporter [Methyloprofundus sp.]|nr:cation:proton antiporter [Methyloprofundus sp.]MDT8425518.1 cation:proton antiporter [Methyloprofundus sp.]